MQELVQNVGEPVIVTVSQVADSISPACIAVGMKGALAVSLRPAGQDTRDHANDMELRTEAIELLAKYNKNQRVRFHSML